MVFFVLFWKKRLLHFLCSLLCYLFMSENFQINIKGKTLRSSRSQMFYKIPVLKHFAALSRKHLCWSLFLIKLQAWSKFLKKTFQYRIFRMNIAKFSRTPISKNICKRMRIRLWRLSYFSVIPAFPPYLDQKNHL